MASSYPRNKNWRRKNPGAWRKCKRRYYAQFEKGAYNAGKEWTSQDKKRIVAQNRPPDRILAAKLGRSVCAIQKVRSRLLHGQME